MTRTRARLLGAATTVSLLGAGLVGVAGPASAALPAECTQESAHKVTCTYTTTDPHSFTVPARVTSLEVEVQGARGGNSPGAVGGAGALVTGDLTVTPGTTLTMTVGGDGEDGRAGNDGGDPGPNGGGRGGDGSGNDHLSGGGGGASDIRTGSGLAARVVVAGGGGGAGGLGAGADDGGSTNGDGSAGQGDPYGGYGFGGGAGMQNSGGQGGSNGNSHGSHVFSQATAGSAGQGGDGSQGDGFSSGGGGGGGLYGGGGGGAEAGGGSGSSLIPLGGTVTTSTTDTPHVTISYDPDPPVAAPPAPRPLGLATADVPHLRGHMMSIDVTGFTPGETYRVKISGVVVGHGTADAKGEIHRKVRVPLRAHRPRAKLVVKGSEHRVHKLIRIRDGIAKP